MDIYSIPMVYSDYRRYNANQTALYQISRQVVNSLGWEIQQESENNILILPFVDGLGYISKIKLHIIGGCIEYFCTTDIDEVTLDYLNYTEKLGKQFFNGIQKHLNGYHRRKYPQKKYCNEKAKTRWRVHIV